MVAVDKPRQPEFLTIRQVADRLICGLSTAYALANSGKLTKICVGPKKAIRVVTASLEEFISRQTDLKRARTVKLKGVYLTNE